MDIFPVYISYKPSLVNSLTQVPFKSINTGK